MKLTNAQYHALRKLDEGGLRPAYPGLKLGTLYSLCERGLARRINMPGYILAPRTRICFRITPAGRAALRETE